MSFGQSDPKIYNSMSWGGLLKEYNDIDVFRRLSKIQNLNFYWDATEMRLKKFGPQVMGLNTPWCHNIHTKSTKTCSVDHHIAFNQFGIIPPKCLECWKVVVTPETFEDLMEMEKIQTTLTFPCKCGIEMRDYTPKHYGAYFYNDSLDDGRACYEWVKEELVRKQMTNGDELAETVILKRGCTEYEMIKGPSPYWHMTDDEAELYDIILRYVDSMRNNSEQPEPVKQHIKQMWALWAHANGDMTYKNFNGDLSLFPDYVKYHEGDINGIKADIAMAKAKVIAGVDPEITFNFLNVAQKFANENKTTLRGLTHSLGVNDSNPMFPNLQAQYHEEVKGDHDELT